MKYVLFYESAGDVRARAAEHFPAHRARIDDFHAQGTLLLIGPFSDPQAGAMSVFSTREAAEAFAEGDPFVHHGVVERWRVEEWNEVLGP